VRVGKPSFKDVIIDGIQFSVIYGLGMLLASAVTRHGRPDWQLVLLNIAISPVIWMALHLLEHWKPRPEIVAEVTPEIEVLVAKARESLFVYGGKVRVLPKALGIPSRESRYLVDAILGKKLPSHVSVDIVESADL
jgi:hypothetical protein